MHTTTLTGQRVRFSQPGTEHFTEGTVKGPDAFLADFVNVLWSRGDGSRTMLSVVHASRCEVLA